MAERPLNVLYLHSHDTGRYVQPYGHPVPTPKLQAFAEESVLFRQAFCANPTCSPSRAALLSGQYAHSCGMFGLAHRGFAMADYRRHLVQHLKRHGYRTTLIGTQHEHRSWQTVGYDQQLGDSSTAEPAVRFLHSQPQAPFFLSVGFSETHRRFPELEPDDQPQYTMPPAYFPDTPETRADFARYCKSAAILDEKMGAILQALDDSGLGASTLVILTTDHGIAFPRMKCNLTDGGIGVMLMLRGPGFAGGRVSDELVSQIDIYPTVCELAGIETPTHVQGRSLLPLLTGEADTVRSEVFAEVNCHGSNEPLRCVRTKRWKYIRRFGFSHLSSCDGGESKSFWLDAGWADRPAPEVEMYDLVLDPNEMRNLAEDAYFAPIRQQLEQRLEQWMADTDDPLLDGPLQLTAEHNLLDEPNCLSDVRIPLALD